MSEFAGEKFKMRLKCKAVISKITLIQMIRYYNICDFGMSVWLRVKHSFQTIYAVAVRQQAITWANLDPDLCCHMASLRYNVLTGPNCYAHSCLQ